jgi:hypothetical protein
MIRADEVTIPFQKMSRRDRNLAATVMALALLYALSAYALARALPGPHQQFDYMVIGTGSTGVTMLAFFVSRIVRLRFLTRIYAPYCSKNRQTVRMPR